MRDDFLRFFLHRLLDLLFRSLHGLLEEVLHPLIEGRFRFFHLFLSLGFQTLAVQFGTGNGFFLLIVIGNLLEGVLDLSLHLCFNPVFGRLLRVVVIHDRGDPFLHGVFHTVRNLFQMFIHNR